MRFEEKRHSLALARVIVFLRSLNIATGLFVISRVLKVPSSIELLLALAIVLASCFFLQTAFYAAKKAGVFEAKEAYINLAVLAALAVMGLLFGR